MLQEKYMTVSDLNPIRKLTSLAGSLFRRNPATKEKENSETGIDFKIDRLLFESYCSWFNVRCKRGPSGFRWTPIQRAAQTSEHIIPTGRAGREKG
jgi:hypothetical protein